MNQLNSLILEGNLVKDAVLTEPAPGFKKCVFTMGVNRFYKNKNNEAVNEASFFDVEAYNQVAEYCSKKATKGRGVRVVGRLKQDTWKDTSGKTASRIYVVAEHIEYKPEKKTSEIEEKTAASAAPAETPAPAETSAESLVETAAEVSSETPAEASEQIAVEEKQTQPVPVEEAAVF